MTTTIKEQALSVVKSLVACLSAIKFIYRGSRDGWNANNIFHRLCDRKGPTPTLVS